MRTFQQVQPKNFRSQHRNGRDFESLPFLFEINSIKSYNLNVKEILYDMKRTLTIEESNKLIELGLDPNLASKEVIENVYQIDYEPRPRVFTFSDIFSILPKEIEGNGLITEWNQSAQKWEVRYGNVIWSYCSSSEIIVALANLLERAINHGYIKLNIEKK